MEIISALLPHLTGLRLEAVVVRGVAVRTDAATQTMRSPCGVCGTWSTTMHGRYVRRIDVLPDRTADTLAAWLLDLPGVQIICRDRGGSYADGARKGAPEAIQVADRWHLLKNLSDTVEKVIRGHRRCLRTHAEPTSALVAPVDEPVRTGRRAANTRQRHAAVHALRAEGLSISATARRLDMNVRTAR